MLDKKSRDITILNVYILINRALKFTKQKWTEVKREIDILTAVDFYSVFSKTDKITKQKINNDIENLNNTIK